MDIFSGSFIFILVLIGVFLAMSIRVLNEFERGVVFRLGRSIGAKGPGLIILIPVIDRMVKVDLRTVTLDVPPQDIITNDNVTVTVNAVIYFRVVEANRSVIEIENYYMATSKLSQTTLRSILGRIDLDTLLSSRDKINQQLQDILDEQTEPWGVKIANVEIKQVDLPTEMQRMMAKQAEAERERRAKVIAAEAEKQAAQRLSDAAEILGQRPMSLQLRYLQTLLQMSNEKSTMTVVPLPMEFLKGIMGSEQASNLAKKMQGEQPEAEQ